MIKEGNTSKNNSIIPKIDDGESEEQIRILSMKLTNKETQILSLEKQIRELESDMERLRRTQSVISSVDRFKLIVQLYAYGYSTGLIYKVLTEEHNIDMTIEEIDIFLNKLDFADIAIQNYYIECKKAFQEKAELDKSFLTNSTIKKYLLLENELTISLIKAKEGNDEAMKIKVISELIKVYEKMSLLYGKVGNQFDKNKVTDMLNNYDKRTEEALGSDNIVEFKPNSKFKVV